MLKVVCDECKKLSCKETDFKYIFKVQHYLEDYGFLKEVEKDNCYHFCSSECLMKMSKKWYEKEK